MLGTIAKVFDYVKKVWGVYAVAVTLTEEELKDGESSEKEEKALEIVEKALDELVEKGNIPGWLRDIFFSDFLSKYIITILVKVAHKIDFFIKGEDSEQETGE